MDKGNRNSRSGHSIVGMPLSGAGWAIAAIDGCARSRGNQHGNDAGPVEAVCAGEASARRATGTRRWLARLAHALGRTRRQAALPTTSP